MLTLHIIWDDSIQTRINYKIDMEILDQMLHRAQANPQRIVLPEGDEPRTLEAANLLLKD